MASNVLSLSLITTTIKIPWDTCVIAFVAVDVTEKVSRIRSNIIWNRWNSGGKIHMSEPESGNGNVN